MPNIQQGTTSVINGLTPQQAYQFRVTPIYRVSGGSSQSSATTELETYRLLAESGDNLATETLDLLRRETNG